MKARDRLLFLVGPLPPPLNGESIAFSLIVEALGNEGVPIRVFDISSRDAGPGSASNSTRALDYAALVPRYFSSLLTDRPRTVYVTLSQSRRGFLRDAAFLWLAALAGAQVVAHLHGGNYDCFYRGQPALLRFCIRATLRRVTTIIVLGDRLRSMFDFDRALSHRIRVVPNGVAPARSPAEPKALAQESGPLRLLFLSNLIESKGYFELLEALRILVCDYGVDAYCDFCGAFLPNPSDDVRVRDARQARHLFDELVREYGLEGRARYRGVVDSEAKAAALHEAHVVVLPTRYDAEGQPISIIEAMSYACPVVSTYYRAIPDLVEDGSTGYLLRADIGDLPRAIADAICAITATPESLSEMSRAALQRYHSLFSVTKHVERMRTILLQ